MSDNEFLERFPIFTPTKEWLVCLNWISWWEFVHDWYLIDDFFVPYCDYFYYHGTSKKMWVNYALCWWIIHLHEAKPDINCFMRFDISKRRPRNSYIQWDIWAWWRWLPRFDIKRLLGSKSDIVSEKHRRNPKFDALFGNHIKRTEFFYDVRRNSLQIEEISSNTIDNNYSNRYLHTEFSLESGLPNHFDWTLLFYSKEEKDIRDQTSLDKRTKNAHNSIKLFRIDWDIGELDVWIFLTMKWFVGNELITEWFDPENYVDVYHDILIKDVDY